ncbi:MAG: ATP phosphoribosyltransferase regulatory subunit [bacterium]|nr:ATP phosphoribosyltransferase regulatory subunit [bacterium]
MNEILNRTPNGMKDLLLRECEINREITSRLSDFFSKRGYREVITPVLEYFDLFNLPSSDFTQEEIYKSTDLDNRLLVLRPDMTMPIARLSATRLRDAQLPLRFFYNQKVFRLNRNLKGRRNEINQSGIELIGEKGVLSDLEIISLAFGALQTCGIDYFAIEIGHANIFKKLAEKLPVGKRRKEQIRKLIESKNYSALDDELTKISDTGLARDLKMLPRLFGGVEVFDIAEQLYGTIISDEIAYLKKIYSSLSTVFGDKIRVDLGLVHRNNYYSDIVFRGYITGSGTTVVSGGRYDNLFDDLDCDRPAIGFAVDVDAICDILLANENPCEQSPDMLVFAAEGYEMKALEYMNECIKKGMMCEMMSFVDVKSAEQISHNRNVSFAVVGKDIFVTEIKR